MNKIGIVLSFVFAVAMASVAVAESELFPFVVSFDAPNNATNIASHLDAPAGKDGFVRVENGHFVTDKGRIRFWGTNTSFVANFLDKEVADRMADRLARFGINCVRLHHMDRKDIWGDSPTQRAKSLMEFDKGQLDKLDYYVAALKKRGIYVNMNLHVSRIPDERDGFPPNVNRVRNDKGVDHHYRPLIEANKKYAYDLLTHINPYTGNAYKDEPAVAVIEINNENAIQMLWGGWGGLEDVQDPFLSDLRKHWNDWLKAKYGTDAALQKSWAVKGSPLGKEMLTNGNFPKGFLADKDGWKFAIEPQSQFNVSNPTGSLLINVRGNGEVLWRTNLYATGFAVKKGQIYTLTIKAKANKNAPLNFVLRTNDERRKDLGFTVKAGLTTDWQEFVYTVSPTEDETNVRLGINGFKGGVNYAIESVSLKPGGRIGLREGQSLEKGTIPPIWKPELANYTKEAVDDFCDWMFDIEAKYWDEMYRYLKDEVKVKQPVSGTQLAYGSTIAQAKMDYCDIHSYWNLGATVAGGGGSLMHNKALVNYVDVDILPKLATRRVYGKPLTLSEFNSKDPNQYAAEALPIIAAFGAFQDWDGIFQYSYAHGDPEPRKVTSHLDICGNPVKMAHMIACSKLFRGHIDPQALKEVVVAPMNGQQERDIFKQKLSPGHGFPELGIDQRIALLRPTAIDVSGKVKSVTPFPAIPVEQKRFFVQQRTPDQSFLYDMESPGRGLVAVSRPDVGFFTGFVEEKKNYPLLDGAIRFGKTNLGWATASLTRVDGGRGPKRMLLVLTGEMRNTGMEVKQTEAEVITVNALWGRESVLCEGVPAILEFKGKQNIKCWVLDESGNRKQELNVTKSNGMSRIEAKQEYQTIWYEIEE